MGDHLAVVARQTGKVPKGFESTECPPELFYLWEHFARLCGKRKQDGMGGVSPIDYADIRSYVWAYKLPRFEAWEVAVLDQLDTIWRAIRSEVLKRQAANVN